MKLIHAPGIVIVLCLALTPVVAWYGPEFRYPGYNGYGAPLQGPFGPYYIEDAPGADFYVTPGGTFTYNGPGFSWSPYFPSGGGLSYLSRVSYPSAPHQYANGYYHSAYQRPFWPRQPNPWYASNWYLNYPTTTYYTDWYRRFGGFPNPDPNWQH